MILRCSCKHEFQDKQYGAGNRVHNDCKPGEKNTKWYRCTVCRKERTE